MGLKLSLQFLKIPVFQPLPPESSFIIYVYICYSAPKNHWPVVLTLRLGNAKIADKNQCNSGSSGGY